MDINFVFQVRSFHRLKREIKFSANAQALWLELFGLFNEKRFPDSLPVSTTQLAAMLGISKDSVIRARKELYDADLLEEAGERKGRQHTVYRIKYFSMRPASSKDDAGARGVVNSDVEKPGKPVDNPICDAPDDANCNATGDGKFATHQTTQVATQNQTGRFCDAPDDANCDAKCVVHSDTNINNKRIGVTDKPKRGVTGKRKRILRLSKKIYTATAPTGKNGRAREGMRRFAEDNFVPDKGGPEETRLCYNEAWRTDERARRRTAQNVIDACKGLEREDGMNALLCRYMGYGMSPEQEYAALLKKGEGVPALDALNEAAHRLGVYRAAQEGGRISVDAETLYCAGGNETLAKHEQKRRGFKRFLTWTKANLMSEGRAVTPGDVELNVLARDVYDSPLYKTDGERYAKIAEWLEKREGGR